MAKIERFTKQYLNNIQHACTVILAHPAVKQIDDPDYGETTVRVKIVVEVPLPNAWRAKGQSPNGVKRFEEVYLDFPPGFPLDPPEPSLRPDFSRDLAHMQPWLSEDGRPVPCIQDGKMSEFIHQEGIRGVINQTVLWLDHAAEGRLINEKQGWEVTRRDQICDYLIADEDALRAYVDKRGGYRLLLYRYLRGESPVKPDWLHGQIIDKQVPLNQKAARAIFREDVIDSDRRLFLGMGLSLVVWPGKTPSGDPITCAQYAPEDVIDLASLKGRAALYGCKREFSDGLSHLSSCVKDYDQAGPFNLAIVFCVRRPFNLIGKTTSIELCAYFIDFNAGEAFPSGDATPVRPAGHREQISPALLARLSNFDVNDDNENDLPWALIGTGSLGSKLAIHMARAGRAPISVVDNSKMNPHNVARHALIPPSGDMQLRFIDAKANLLSNAVRGFSQSTNPLVHDVVSVIHARSLAKKAWPKGTWAIVNTTASLRVRAALSAAGDSLRARVIESVLYGRGKLGLIATEGPGHNPSLGALFSHFYVFCKSDNVLQHILFRSGEHDLERTAIGQGCGSSTMQMSDGRISLFGAATTEYLLSRQRDGLPENGGECLVGLLDESGLGVSWNHVDVPPCTIVKCGNGEKWSVHISGEVVNKIAQEVSQWPTVETGGVLLGRQDEISKAFYVVDVISAPPDSKRSSHEFVLGKEGIGKKLDDYAKETNWALYCLGTWHSHLNPSGPSGLDRQTAHAIGLARLAPSVLLIHTPDGFQALLAQHISGMGAR
ncbi:MAG: Mov34/MPN/PAD-1 family protein [Candidatus Thiodiazotropha sp. (ex Dulcina madagascariensis)]|nr:Mov34/MPN/PAD-1 family protein [Candidatus Thiodiazotropha sp. (ex Dulcina madagascariensis)]